AFKMIRDDESKHQCAFKYPDPSSGLAEGGFAVVEAGIRYFIAPAAGGEAQQESHRPYHGGIAEQYHPESIVLPDVSHERQYILPVTGGLYPQYQDHQHM